MHCTAKLCFTSGSTCILRVSVKCLSFVMDSVTNSNTLLFCSRWNCYRRTPTRPHCMGRLHIVSEGIYTHAQTYLYYFLPLKKSSAEKTPKCYSLKAGKGQAPLPTFQKPQTRGCCEVFSGSAADLRRAEREPGPGPGGPGSRVHHPSSRAGGGSSRFPPKRMAAGSPPAPGDNCDGGWSASLGCNSPVHIFISLQNTVNDKF